MKKDYLDKDFDERQIAERGRAFRNAFLTIVAAMTVMFFTNDALELYLFDSSAFYLMPTVLSLSVFISTAVRKDAFAGYNGMSNAVPAVLGCVGLFLTINSIIELVRDRVIIDVSGYLDDCFTHLFCGLCYLAVGITYIIKKISDKKTENI